MNFRNTSKLYGETVPDPKWKTDTEGLLNLGDLIEVIDEVSDIRRYGVVAICGPATLVLVSIGSWNRWSEPTKGVATPITPTLLIGKGRKWRLIATGKEVKGILKIKDL